MTNSKIKAATPLFLILTMAITIVALPTINTASAMDWYPYITASPSPVGVGQRVLVVFGFPMPTASAANSYYGWTLTITDPDGDTETISDLNTESTGSTFYVFTPDKVGTWKLKAHYPGGNVTFSGGVVKTVPEQDTNEFSLTVQDEQLTYPAETPLPSDYWTFPIYGENRDWSSISGNWLMPAYDNSRHFDSGGSAFNPYTTVPNTAHVLWTKGQLFGGIAGGSVGDINYYAGLAYRNELLPPIIISGRLYYNEMQEPRNGFYCVDLSTGETIWQNNGTYTTATGVTVSGASAQLTVGQILAYNSPNGHGAFPFLWSTGSSNWAIWDAWTGDLIYTVVNAPAISNFGQAYSFHTDETGTLYAWRLDTTTKTLALWNSTKMMSSDPRVMYSFYTAGMFSHSPGISLDWTTGIEWNVTIADIDSSYALIGWDPKDMSVIILSNQSRGLVESVEAFEDVAISGEDGHVLWRQVRNEGTWEQVVGGQGMSIEADTYVYERKETRQVYAYSISTGAKKWVTDARENQWGMYLMGVLYAYGNFYVPGYDGLVVAYDADTGDEVWTFGPIYAGLETPYGVYPFYGGLVAADGKVIAYQGEHSADAPLYRGERMYVLNATTGDEIWSISGWCQMPCAANGIILTPNGYDGQLYCFGKGPSTTTVTIQTDVITEGSSVVIQGSVLDVSAGTQQTSIAARFPTGVAAVSDASMSEWMEYVYQQKTCPSNATGVTVSLDVIDANGNFRNIGTAKTDISGQFGFAWEPDIPGLYTVIATFPGSEAYGSSYAETYFNVMEVEATPEPTPAPQSAADLYFVPAVIGLLVAIIVVGALVMLMLRKR